MSEWLNVLIVLTALVAGGIVGLGLFVGLVHLIEHWFGG